jgi:hypothetical protein
MGIWDYMGKKAGGIKSAWQQNKQLKQQMAAQQQAAGQQAAGSNAPQGQRWSLWKNRGRMAGQGTLAAGAAVAGVGYGAYQVGKWSAQKGVQGYQKTKEAVQEVRFRYRYDILLIVSLIWYFVFGVWSRGSFGGRFSANIVFILFIYYFVLAPSERKDRITISLMGLIFLWEVFVPYFVYKSPLLLSNKWVMQYLMNPQITLPWFYFALIRGDGVTLLQKCFRIGVFFLLIYQIMSIGTVWSQFENIQSPMTPEQIAKAESIYTSAYKWWKDVALNFGKVMRQGKDYWYNKYWYATTGDYYAGSVDEKQQETLGVFIKNIKPATSEFYYGEPVSVWALLQAKSLEDGISVNVSCAYGQKDKDGKYPQTGNPKPDSIPLVFDEEQVDLDCRYNGMPEGSNKVAIIADFNYETMGYLKTYFIDQDRLRGLQRNGIDPLDEYFITDKKPTARYTNGPVMIGMGSVDPPIGISDKTADQPRLGITLSTNTGWKGRIKQIEELTIMVPDSMSLDTNYCTEFKEVPREQYITQCTTSYQKYRTKTFLDCVSQAGLSRDQNVDANGNFIGVLASDDSKKATVASCMKSYCENEINNYKAYSLSIDNTNKIYYSNIGMDVTGRQYKTFSCRVKIDNAAKVLGDMPISIQYFRTKARYTYQIEESTNVNVKPLPVDPLLAQQPKFPDSANIPGTVAAIYSQYYSKYPYIKDACTKSGLFADEQKCFCMVTSIIAKESGGNLAVKDGAAGEVSLMQITDGAITEVTNKYGQQCTNKRDPACNILLGAFYLKLMSEQPNAGQQPKDTQYKVDNTVVPANVAAGYNCGPKAMYTTTNCNGVLNWECAANEAKCLVDGKQATRLTYVPYVLERYKKCMSLNLQKATEFQEVKDSNIMMESSIALDIKQKVRLTQDKPFWVAAFSSEMTNYYATIYYGLAADTASQMTNSMPLVKDTWIWDPAYPLVTLKYDGTTTLRYQYLAKAVSKEVTLYKNKKKDSGSSQVEDLTEVFPNWIYAFYGDEGITLRDRSLTRKFCTVPWSTWEQQTVGTCNEAKLLGFKIINKETYDPTRYTTPPYGTDGYAKVQIQFDPDAKDPCCSDCQTCNQKSDVAIRCNSCKDACTTKAGTLWGTTCEKKSS